MRQGDFRIHFPVFSASCSRQPKRCTKDKRMGTLPKDLLFPIKKVSLPRMCKEKTLHIKNKNKL